MLALNKRYNRSKINPSNGKRLYWDSTNKVWVQEDKIEEEKQVKTYETKKVK